MAIIADPSGFELDTVTKSIRYIGDSADKATATISEFMQWLHDLPDDVELVDPSQWPIEPIVLEQCVTYTVTLVGGFEVAEEAIDAIKAGGWESA